MPEKKRLLVFDPLDKNFCPSKPVQNIDCKDLSDKEAAQLVKAGIMGITLKRDGFCHISVKTKREKIYTRGINEATERFPHLVGELAALNLPAKTILVGEIIFGDGKMDDWEMVSKICQSGPERAIKLQKELGWVRYLIFNVMFWDGQEYIKRPYQENYDLIHSLLPEPTEYLLPVDFLDISYYKALKMIKKQGWEGLVLWDKTQGSTYSLEGKTLRPLSCFKRKLVQEDDFIVRNWESSKNDSARMAKLYLSQIDPNTRQEFSCGACGGGFTNQWRKELANDKLYPFVAEIKFFKRFSSGALFSSKFFRIRTDKKIKECIAPKSFVFKKRKRKEKK